MLTVFIFACLANTKSFSYNKKAPAVFSLDDVTLQKAAKKLNSSMDGSSSTSFHKRLDVSGYQQSCAAMNQRQAGDYSCGDRINYMTTLGYSDAQAYAQVNSEYPSVCVCDNPPTGDEGNGGKVCVFDIDGTLLNNADENLSRAAIQACKDAGYLLAVNTAEDNSQCQANKPKLAALGLTCPDEVYTCLTNYDWSISKPSNMRTISGYYDSPSKCTLLFDDYQPNIDAVKKAGWLGQKVHSSRNGISPDELQSALSQLAKCGGGPGPTPTPAPKPSDCTDVGHDPWSTGNYVDCCSGLKACLYTWDSGRSPYYLCEPPSYSHCYNSEGSNSTQPLKKSKL